VRIEREQINDEIILVIANLALRNQRMQQTQRRCEQAQKGE